MTRYREKVGVWSRPVLKAINDFWKEHSFPPSMKQIMEMTGITTKSVVQYEYRRLAEQGHIDIFAGKPRPRWVKDRIEGAKAVPGEEHDG